MVKHCATVTKNRSSSLIHVYSVCIFKYIQNKFNYFFIGNKRYKYKKREKKIRYKYIYLYIYIYINL